MYRKVNINPVNDKYFMLKNTAEGTDRPTDCRGDGHRARRGGPLTRTVTTRAKLRQAADGTREGSMPDGFTLFFIP